MSEGFTPPNPHKLDFTMVDFVKRATCAEAAMEEMGFKMDAFPSFIDRYSQVVQTNADLAVYATVTGQLLLPYLDSLSEDHWEGTMTDLKKNLDTWGGGHAKELIESDEWSKMDAPVLGKQVRMMQSMLQIKGWKTLRTGQRTTRFKKIKAKGSKNGEQELKA